MKNIKQFRDDYDWRCSNFCPLFFQIYDFFYDGLRYRTLSRTSRCYWRRSALFQGFCRTRKWWSVLNHNHRPDECSRHPARRGHNRAIVGQIAAGPSIVRATSLPIFVLYHSIDFFQVPVTIRDCISVSLLGTSYTVYISRSYSFDYNITHIWEWPLGCFSKSLYSSVSKMIHFGYLLKLLQGLQRLTQSLKNLRIEMWVTWHLRILLLRRSNLMYLP